MILHLIDSLALGGAERMAVEIANATDPEHSRAAICVTRTDATLANRLRPEVQLVRLGRTRTWDYQKFRDLVNYIRRFEVKVLHIHGRSSLYLAAFIRSIWRELGAPGWVFHDHFGDVEVQPRFPLRLRLALHLTYPVYVGVHPKLTQSAKTAGMPASRVRTLRNAIDFRPYQTGPPREPRQTGQPKGIAVANVRPSKDLHTLILALGKLRQYPWDISIYGAIVDPAYARTCRELIRQLGIENRVHFAGQSLDIENRLGEADFGVLSSRSESGPLALIEYAAAGLPFASTRVGLVGSAFEQRGIGEFADPGDPAGLAEALLRVIDLPSAERQQRGECARVTAAELFEINRVMPEWYEVYESAISSSRR